MNSEANLVVLCKKCHRDVHNDKIIINGYNETSKGRILDYQIIPTLSQSATPI